MKAWRRLGALGVVLSGLALGGWTSGGTTPGFVSHMVFQNGVSPTSDYAGFSDTYIRPGTASADTGKNYGASDSLKLSGPSATTVGENRILWRCELTGIPDTAQVGRAILWLYQCAPNSNLAVAMNDSSAMVVHRLFNPWTEGVGTNASPTAPPHASACWNRRKGQQGAKWWLAGGMGRTNGAAIIPQWRSGFVTGGDSTVGVTGYGYWGCDSIYNGASVTGYNVDVPSIALHRATPKAGTQGARRLGWVGIDVTHQVDLWVRGANENNGCIIALPPWSTQTTQFTFYSSNSTKVLDASSGPVYRPKLEVWFTNGKTSSGGGVATSTRLGMGLTGSYGPH